MKLKIVSEFNLNDAIESGIVKTRRVVVRGGAVQKAKIAWRGSSQFRLHHTIALLPEPPRLSERLSERMKLHEQPFF